MQGTDKGKTVGPPTALQSSAGVWLWEVRHKWSFQPRVADGVGKLSSSLHSPVSPSQESLPPLCLCLSLSSSSVPAVCVSLILLATVPLISTPPPLCFLLLGE